MENDIKVSVIIPVYNAEKYIAQCLQSVIDQTLQEIEIIIVNDGSIDNSLQIVKDFQNKDKRIKIIDQENRGAGNARNTGMSEAKGKYLSLLDADDFFELSMLEEMYDACEKNDADICVVRSKSYDNVTGEYADQEWTIKKEMLPENNPFSYKDIPGYIFNIFNGWAWDKLFRREFVMHNGILFQDIRSSEDMLFVDMSLVFAKRIFVLDRMLAFHRVNLQTSVSVTREKTWDCFYIALLELKKQLLEADLYEEVKKSFINWAANFTAWQLDSLKKGKSFFLAYDLMHSEGIEKLDILKLEKSDFYNEFDYEFCKYVSEKDPYQCAETLLDCYKSESIDYRNKYNESRLLKEEYENKYKESCALNEKYEREKTELEAKNERLTEQKRQLKRRCHELENSTTFKLGKAMLWLPCKILRKK